MSLAWFCQHLSMTVVWFSANCGNTCFNNPSQIAVEACTNPLYKRNPNFVTRVQQYLQTPVWSLMRSQESYPAASCVHSRDPKTFNHPWAAYRSKRTMFEHAFHARCSYLFWTLVPLHFLHNTIRQKKPNLSWISAFKSTISWWFQTSEKNLFFAACLLTLGKNQRFSRCRRPLDYQYVTRLTSPV